MQTNQEAVKSGRDNVPARNREIDVERFVDQIDRDGFTVIPSVFARELAEQARVELERLMDGPFGPENLGFYDQVLHVALPGKSKIFDQMLEHILTDPLTSTVLKRVGGENLKIRDINGRRMTGVLSEGDLYNPPLEWHRDGPEEFGIGILLTDVDEDDAPTGFIKGTHKIASDPRWDAMLGMPFYTRETRPGSGPMGLKWLSRCNPFSRMLWRKNLKEKVASATGKQGDIYVFINQAWHSRMPNRNGKKSVVVLCGVWPSEATFSAGTQSWSEATLAGLPPTLAKALRADAPPNQPSDTLLRKMMQERVPDRPLSPFWLAAKEKRVVSRFSEAVQAVQEHLPSAPSVSVGAIKRKLRPLIPDSLVDRLRGR